MSDNHAAVTGTTIEDGHVVISFDVYVSGQVVATDTLTVGLTADPDHVRDLLAARAHGAAALLSLEGQSIPASRA